MGALERLQTPDERTLAFTPMGLGLGVQMHPEAAAAMWSEEAERLALEGDVGEETRAAFAALARVLPYGVLCYELFTLVHDRALFVLELALRERFIEHHARECGGVVPLSVDGRADPVPAVGYADVARKCQRLGRRGRTVELVVRESQGLQERITFRGGLGDLLSWARELDLLYGQRSAVAENAIKDLRNAAAHPEGRHLLMPTSALLTLRDLAEVINHLWGHRTPGGRLYPGPVERRTVVLAWDARGGSAVSLAENLADAGWEPYTQFALVMATWPAPIDLHDFDSRFEATAAPVKYLWGPGTRKQALDHLGEQPPTSDTANVLGRRFMVRVDEDRVWQPMRPEVASLLPEPDRAGRWHLIQTDTSAAALRHVLGLQTGTTCTNARTCPNCRARNVDDDGWEALVNRIGVPRSAEALPPDFQLPSLARGPRSYAIHD